MVILNYSKTTHLGLLECLPQSIDIRRRRRDDGCLAGIHQSISWIPYPHLESLAHGSRSIDKLPYPTSSLLHLFIFSPRSPSSKTQFECYRNFIVTVPPSVLHHRLRSVPVDWSYRIPLNLLHPIIERVHSFQPRGRLVRCCLQLLRKKGEFIIIAIPDCEYFCFWRFLDE